MTKGAGLNHGPTIELVFRYSKGRGFAMTAHAVIIPRQDRGVRFLEVEILHKNAVFAAFGAIK